MNVRGNVQSSASPSYHDAWYRTVAKLWDEDQRRMEYLTAYCKEEKNRGFVNDEQTRERIREMKRRWMQRKRLAARVPCECGGVKDKGSLACMKCMRNSPCIVCGKHQARPHSRCRTCYTKLRCPDCGEIQWEGRLKCRKCKYPLSQQP